MVKLAIHLKVDKNLFLILQFLAKLFDINIFGIVLLIVDAGIANEYN